MAARLFAVIIGTELRRRSEFHFSRKSQLVSNLAEAALLDSPDEAATVDRLLQLLAVNPNRKIFEARKRETAALGAGEKLVLGHPLAATIGDSARCMQNLEKVLFTGPKTSDTVTFICD